MSSIGNIARVSDGGNGSIPSISDDEIETNAWLVWESVHSQRKAEGSRTRMEHPRTGQPGYAWMGSVNRIYAALWPALKDTRLISGSEAEHRKIAINRWLRNSGNLYCYKDHGHAKASVWWISEHWGGMTTTHVGDKGTEPSDGDTSADVLDLAKLLDESTMPVEHEEDTTVTKTTTKREPQHLPCRVEGCDRVFKHPQLRGGHEKMIHGVHVRPDGRVITFEPGGTLTDEEIGELIVQVAATFEGPETFNRYHMAIKDLDPRASKEGIRRTLEALSADRKSRLTLVNPGHYFPRYALSQTRVKVAKEQVDKLSTKLDEVKDVVEASNVTTEPDVTAGGGEEILPVTPGMVTAVRQHLNNLTELVSYLEDIERHEADINTLTRELATVTVERDEALRLVSHLEAELEVVKRDRDQVTKDLDDIRRILRGGITA